MNPQRRRRALALVVLAGTTLGQLASCRQESAPSDTQFTVYSDAHVKEQLKTFYDNLATKKRAEVCIGLVGFDSGSERAKNYPVFALNSLRRWLTALRSTPAWQGKSTPELIHAVQYSPCQLSDLLNGDRFGITFYSKQRDFKADICGPNSSSEAVVNGRRINQLTNSLKRWLCQDNQGASFGQPGFGAVYVSPLIGAGDRHPVMESSIMHELGHVFGLGDTYDIGQSAPSIMKYSGGVNLYPDDLAGLNQAVRTAYGAELSCPTRKSPKSIGGSGDQLFCETPPGWSPSHQKEVHVANEAVVKAGSEPGPTLQLPETTTSLSSKPEEAQPQTESPSLERCYHPSPVDYSSSWATNYLLYRRNSGWTVNVTAESKKDRSIISWGEYNVAEGGQTKGKFVTYLWRSERLLEHRTPDGRTLRVSMTCR